MHRVALFGVWRKTFFFLNEPGPCMNRSRNEDIRHVVPCDRFMQRTHFN